MAKHRAEDRKIPERPAQTAESPSLRRENQKDDEEEYMLGKDNLHEQPSTQVEAD